MRSNFVRLGKSGSETLTMIKVAYGDEAMSQGIVFRWHKMFEEVDNAVRPGRPSATLYDENVQKVRHKFRSTPECYC